MPFARASMHDEIRKNEDALAAPNPFSKRIPRRRIESLRVAAEVAQRVTDEVVDRIVGGRLRAKGVFRITHPGAVALRRRIPCLLTRGDGDFGHVGSDYSFS